MPNTEYNSLSIAVHDLVTSINIKHQHLSMCAEYQFLTQPEDKGGMGRVGLREYLSNLKCAVSNSVSRIEERRGVMRSASQFISDARIGLVMLEDLARLELLDAEEKNAIDIEQKLPFWFSHS